MTLTRGKVDPTQCHNSSHCKEEEEKEEEAEEEEKLKNEEVDFNKGQS